MRKKDIIKLMTIFIGVFAIVAILCVGMKKSKPDESLVVDNTDNVIVDGDMKNDEEIEDLEETDQLSNTTEESEEEKSSVEDSKVVTEEKTVASKSSKSKKNTKKKVLNGKNLFIGDSRTEGLMEYGGIKNADFFANTGMSVYNVSKKKLSVPKVGKVTLDILLSKKKYDRIYLMMGVNEGGYNFDKTVSKYKALVKYIMKKQPKAKVILQANIHVTKERSDKDKYINNKRINNFNKAISKIADKKKIFYIDDNVLFDDKSGNLDKKKTADDAHPYAKYYEQWGQWIIDKTSSI